jgi:hypothetical protein
MAAMHPDVRKAIMATKLVRNVMNSEGPVLGKIFQNYPKETPPAPSPPCSTVTSTVGDDHGGRFSR